MSHRNRPSIQDVAAHAGVSLGTVSNVLNNPSIVKSDTSEKVHAAIADLGYIRNDAARQLKAGNSHTIGMIVLDAANPFFSEIIRGAEDASSLNRFAILIGNSSNQSDRELQYLKLFEEQRVGGILISPTGKVLSQVKNLRSRGVQTVLVDQKASKKDACSVSVDDLAGGRLAVSHLLDAGAKRIAFVGGSQKTQQVKDRLLGARDAIARHPGASIEVIETSAMNVLAGRDVGELISLRPKNLRPDAVFAANDLLAVGLLQAFLYKNKVRIPEEILVVGYDDIHFAESTLVPLSSIRQPSHEIGTMAVELLLDEITNELHSHKQITYQPELIIRESTTRRRA